MQNINQINTIQWQWWRRFLFRFCFIYFLLQIINWLSSLGFDIVTHYYYDMQYKLADWMNNNWFHFKYNRIYTDDDGSDPFGWAVQWTVVSLAFIGSLTWSVTGRRRKNYIRLNYWLCLVTRYSVAMVALTYGLDKIQLLQMPFPNKSLLATPLGDLAPGRLAWVFVGYSAPYQFFSGLMECLVAVLLFYRRTVTLGVMIGIGVFANVLMLNLGYDMSVKILAMNLLLACLFLLANEWNRIVCFFFLNRSVATCNLYHFSYEQKGMRITQKVLKVAVLTAIVFLYWNSESVYDQKATNTKPIQSGIYNVLVYTVNKDTIPAIVTDSARWQNMIFEANGTGSINTADSNFRKRYNRSYFAYSTDTIKHTLTLRKFADDSLPVMIFNYTLTDTATINLWGKENNDLLYVKLVKSNRHFQLEERRIKWLGKENH